MLIKENKRFKALFIAYIKSLSTTSSTTSYGGYNYSSGSYNYGGGITKHIYFYEFSNVLGSSKHFTSIDEFCDFCSKHNITVTDEQLNIIKTNNWCYCTCVPGKSILLMTDQYYKLRESVESCEKNKLMVTSLVPFYS